MSSCAPRRWLSYGTNVHPGEGLDEILAGIERHLPQVSARAFPGGGMALSLRLGARAVAELRSRASRARLEAFLDRHGVRAGTLNLFPQGEFHAPVVKAAVYAPDWTDPARLAYTLEAAGILAGLLADDSPFGSLSTLPLGHGPGFAPGGERRRGALRNLVAAARGLERLEEQTGRLLILALEPEPFCALDDTWSVLRFFEEEIGALGAQEAALLRRHLGLCFDACHFAVLHEDPLEAWRRFLAAGIQVPKVQISCALEADLRAAEPDLRSALRPFAEPRFLHQTVVLREDGSLGRFPDLEHFLAVRPLAAAGRLARSHFHVPVHAVLPGPLGTTQAGLVRLLHDLRDDPTPRHLEVETYTHHVLPDPPRDPEALAGAIAEELRWTRAELGIPCP
jgi:hypothetical protein